MAFFDDPAHRPPTTRLEVGDSITGTVTQLAIQTNLRGKPTLTWTLDAGVLRWANRRLWDQFAQARVDIGDTITVTRLPDDPSDGQSMAGTNWSVVKDNGRPVAVNTAAPPVATPVMQLPSWD